VINVRDVNDNSPIFEKTSYRATITEEDDRALPKRVLKVREALVIAFGIDDAGISLGINSIAAETFR